MSASTVRILGGERLSVTSISCRFHWSTLSLQVEGAVEPAASTAAPLDGNRGHVLWFDPGQMPGIHEVIHSPSLVLSWAEEREKN